MSEFFKFVARKRQPAFLKKFLRELESGVYQVPRAVDVLRRYRTEELKLDNSAQRLRLAFPEDKLMRDFVRKYPEAKMQPIELGSFRAPLAKQFALRQLQLMQSDPRLSKYEAFAQVEKDMGPQLRELSGKPEEQKGGFLLNLVHQEEEHHIRTALMEAAALRARQGLSILITPPKAPELDSNPRKESDKKST